MLVEDSYKKYTLDSSLCGDCTAWRPGEKTKRNM